MKIAYYTIRFHTPAFLGSAEQGGQWRAPPFKAQLRQWWRMVFAATHDFKPDVRVMRREEGRLFGHAWLGDDVDECGAPVPARKSLVRMRLGEWASGQMTSWTASKHRVSHPEVRQAVASDLYMGFGPLLLPSGSNNPVLKSGAAIQAGESTRYSLAYPEEHSQMIETALALMNRFGTVGGRSRNGWGSFTLQPEGDTPSLPLATPLRPWGDALTLDWPHAIGSDAGKALIWQTHVCADWPELMKALAILKIGLRTQFILNSGKNASQPEARHWMAYPVTNHSVKTWEPNLRLPNSLRFKVSPAPDQANKLVGLIFHIPCLPPPRFKPDIAEIKGVWSKVHAFLDAPSQQITRLTA